MWQDLEGFSTHGRTKVQAEASGRRGTTGGGLGGAEPERRLDEERAEEERLAAAEREARCNISYIYVYSLAYCIQRDTLLQSLTPSSAFRT